MSLIDLYGQHRAPYAMVVSGLYHGAHDGETGFVKNESGYIAGNARCDAPQIYFLG